GIYGADDANIPVEQVKAFERALKERNVVHTISIYPGVGHAFVKSDTYNKGGAAEKAWNEAVAFLDTHLK
ncbi:MAG TPA: dienelactone hydrolase family protein, partial [Spirochaetia bacterium]|nr:dienelactone hydrolase family protein [Spirochaetia bacterium]